MKKRIFLLTGLFLFLICSFLGCNRNKDNLAASNDSVTLYSDPGLSPLIKSWAAVYNKVNPDVSFKVVEVTDASVPVSLKNNDLGFFRNEKMTLFGTSPWKEVVGREVIVPVINSKNPYANEILERGVSPELLGKIATENGKIQWSAIVSSGQDIPVNLYLIDDPTVSSTLAKFSKVDQKEIAANIAYDSKDLINAVQQDIYSVGICRITDVIDESGQSYRANISLLPIDVNGNGILDYKESIYGDPGTFSRGVWIGKYPGKLVHDIYLYASTRPNDEKEVAFVTWVLSNGQALLDNHGYSMLESNERVAKLQMINSYDVKTADADQKTVTREPLFSNMYFMVMLFFMAIIFFLTISGILVRERRKGSIGERIYSQGIAIHEESLYSPPGLYYDRSHTWAFMDEEGMVKIGIDDFLQHITGPITKIKMKDPGERVKKGNHVFSVVQDGKQLDICAPVSGTIRSVNEELISETSLLNTAPYTKGWVYSIEPSNWLKDIQFLFMGNRYKEWIRSEFSRLKEFFAESRRPETVQFAHVLQDGGELNDSLLQSFGPEVWEDFQTHFLEVTT